MFSVKGSTFTGYDGDGVIAEAGEGYVNRPGGVDGAVIENNTFDLGVAERHAHRDNPANRHRRGSRKHDHVSLDQRVTSVTTNGIGAEAIALTTASDPSSPVQITTVTIKNNSLTATGAGAIDVALAGISGSGTEGTNRRTFSLTGTTYSGSVRALTSTGLDYCIR